MVASRGVRLVRKDDDLQGVRQHVETMLAEGRMDEALDVLFDLLDRLREDNDHLRIRLQQTLRSLFGRSSERSRDDAQQALAGILDAVSAGATATPDASSGGQDKPASGASDKPPPSPPARGTPHGRGAMPEGLPRRTHHRPLSDDERRCACCGKVRPVIGTERRWWIDFEPGSLVVHIEARDKVACDRCDDAGVATAPSETPKPIDGGQPGTGLLARVLVEKTTDLLPLHRQRARLAREGFEVPESTLQGWWSTAADQLAPVARALGEAVLAAPVVEVDATGLPVLDRDSDKGIRLGAVWAACAFGVGVVFSYRPVRREGLQTALGRSTPSGESSTPPAMRWDTRFVIDGEDLIAREVAAGFGLPPQKCLMHARRGFDRAHKANDARALIPLRLFRQIYAVEERARKDKLTPEGLQRRREAETWPLLEELRAWMMVTAPSVPPRGPLGKAIAYCETRWMSLCLFVLDGLLPLDTGEVERRIRTLAVGRKNYLFAGSDAGAERLCAVASLTGTCKLLGVDPWRYLRDVLTRLAGGWPQRRIAELLPAAWAEEQTHQAQQKTPVTTAAVTPA